MTSTWFLVTAARELHQAHQPAPRSHVFHRGPTSWMKTSEDRLLFWWLGDLCVTWPSHSLRFFNTVLKLLEPCPCVDHFCFMPEWKPQEVKDCWSGSHTIVILAMACDTWKYLWAVVRWWGSKALDNWSSFHRRHYCALYLSAKLCVCLCFSDILLLFYLFSVFISLSCL